jgi:hypothetical protein
VFHILGGLLLDTNIMLLSFWFTFPLVWVFIMVMVYFIKSPWRVWGIIASVSFVGALVIYMIKT